MRILLLAGSYPPESGGIAQFMHSFVRSLTAKGIGVEVIGNPKLPQRGYLRRTEICRELVLDRLHGGKFDRVVASSWSPYAVRLPEPFDVFCHGMDLLEPSGSLRYRMVMKRTLHHAARILANSRYTAELAKKFGARAENVRILYPGVDCERFRPPVQRSTESIILSVGRLVARKGFDMIIRALPRLVKQIPNVSYWCVGHGPDRDRLQQLALDLKVSERIRWFGEVDESEKARLYQSAALFAMPNRITESDRSVEGFGIVFLEAGACGLPVIGGNSGGTADAIVDGETGYLVDPIDIDALTQRLLTLLNNADMRQRLGDAGRRRVMAEFREDQISDRYLDWLA